MTVLLFATKEEAQVTLHSLQAKKTSLCENLYETENLAILITGMGPQKTKETLSYHIDNFDSFINLGIAGALHEDYEENRLYEITHVAEDQNHQALLQLCADKRKTLCTVKEPLYDPKTRDFLSTHFDFVDMEGYEIAKACIGKKKQVRMFKIVSDRCDEETPHTIREKLPSLSKALYDQMSVIISEIINVRATGSFTYENPQSL